MAWHSAAGMALLSLSRLYCVARLDTAWMRSLSLGRLLGMAQHIPAGTALLSPGSRHGTALAQPLHSPSAVILHTLCFASRGAPAARVCPQAGCRCQLAAVQEGARRWALPNHLPRERPVAGTAVIPCKTQSYATCTLQDTDTTKATGKAQDSGDVLWSGHHRKPSTAQRLCPP